MTNRKRRVFFHYHKGLKRMSVHFKNKCNIVDNVVCNVKVNTKWNNRQPYLVMQGHASDVVINDGVAIIT